MYRDIGCDITSLKKFRHGEVMRVEDSPIVILKATLTYIPIKEFKQIFDYIKSVVIRDNIEKLIFDKRELTVFHQPSMEWYFVQWKDEMEGYGLTIHRKLLPNDEVFRQSVNIGREQIANRYPEGKFNQLDIRYMEKIEDAIKH